MGILASTLSICHFRVQGQPPLDLINYAAEHLATHRFVSIDEGIEELSVGWVHLEDSKCGDFANLSVCWRDKYLFFSLRRDQRKIPTALLKEHLDKAVDEYKEAKQVTRIGKMVREELKEKVRVQLFAKTLPDPKIYDAVWDTEANLLTFTTLSKSIIETFEEQFKKTFKGLRLTAFHPYARAMSVLSGRDQQRLTEANRAGSDNFLELIKENAWIGCDFMLWLLHQTMNESSEYRVNLPGPLALDAQFVAYINDEVVLSGASENGTQQITVNGPQDQFHEVKSALKGGKHITEATIHLETAGGNWSLTLKGDLFHFASYGSPDVRVEKDTAGEQLERDAVFFDRMGLLDKGLQLFDSLFAAFLKVRLRGWDDQRAIIGGWLEGE